MIQRFLLFLGVPRSRALFLLIAGTGLLSLILNAVRDAGEWVVVVQSLLTAGALIGSAIIIGGRLEREARARWAALLAPALGAVLLGLTVLPQFLVPLIGGALGWLVVGWFVFRARTPTAYQRAIRYLRKSMYAEAVKELDALIKQTPDEPNHYRFRAEVLRVWGKLDRARRDYQKMTELAPNSPLAFNGLAEVLFQAGDLRGAQAAAERSAALAPDDWVAHYNRGMIEDRLGRSSQVVEHLQRALSLKVRDARHRALIQFYLVRAYLRLGDVSAAQSALMSLRRERAGLEEWGKILESEQALTLEKVLGQDIAVATRLANGEIELEAVVAEESRQ